MVNTPRLVVAYSVMFGILGGFVAAVLFQSVPGFAQPSVEEIPKALSAQEFRLMDGQGRVRARLSFSEAGQPYLNFVDESETHRVWIGIATDSGVTVRDTNGKTRLVLSVDQAGEPSLVIRDRQHRTKIIHP